MKGIGLWLCCLLCGTLPALIIGCSPHIATPADDGKDPAERGRVLYEGRRCINCHGVDGLGGTTFPGAPRVIGRTAGDIGQALQAECANPSDPSNCHPLKMPDLTSGQLDDLAAYLRSLQGEQLQNPGPACSAKPGAICTIAGNGVSGNRADVGLLARDQYLFWPQNVALDPQGRVVITDWNNYTIRRIEAAGCRAITAEDGSTGMDCPIVNLIGTGRLGDSCSTAAAPVEAIDAVMNHPDGVIYDDFVPGQNNIILWGWHQWKIKYVPVDSSGATGQIYCLFGNDRGATEDGLAAGFNADGADGPTRFNLPSSCVYDNDGNFYISDQGNLRIRIVLADGDDDNSSAEAFVASRRNNIVMTFAGGLVDEFGAFRRTAVDYSDSGDGGPAALCTLNVLSGFDAIPQMRLALDRVRGLLYVADSENHRIRVIDLNQDPPRIETFAGGGADVAADGVPATEAKLRGPADVDVAPDGSGDVLITDTFNHCVRIVDFESRIIRTVAGTCGAEQGGYAGDGGPATAALLNEPGGSAVGRDGAVYIADTLNHRVRKVFPAE